MAKSKLKDIDKGFVKLMNRLETENEPVLSVGIHAKDNTPYERGTGQEATTAQIGAFHESGTRKMPARPWLNPVIAKNQAKYLKSIGLVQQAFILGLITPAQRRAKLGLVGESITSDLVEGIRNGKFIALAPSTVRARRNRGADGITILIDTGQMVQSISYEVHE